MTAADVTALVGSIELARLQSGGPVVVGISGYCGAGKSTLARTLAARVRGCQRLRGDDFLDPVRTHRRSEDWDGVERDRLAREVLEPFRSGAQSAYRPFDWSRRQLGPPRPLPEADVLVVDVIGLLHPEVRHLLDVAVWCDVDLETAAERGRARDERIGRQHADLWDRVWVPNDRDFAARFDPRASADVVMPPDDAAAGRASTAAWSGPRLTGWPSPPPHGNLGA